MRITRLVFQIFFIEFIIYAAIMFFAGDSYFNCESYCPMGAVETLPLFLKNLQFPCAVNEFNYSIFLGVLMLTVFFKRVFCSWICPLGTLNELVSSIRERFSRYSPMSHNALKISAALKTVVLLVIVGSTFYYYDLVFRPFCPYFTAFGLHGHTTGVLSYFILINIFILTLTVKMGFCRTLCPFGAFLNIFNIRTVFKIYRDEEKCVNCKLCDRVCPAELNVSEAPAVKSAECTMCMNCIGACGKNKALNIGL